MPEGIVAVIIWLHPVGYSLQNKELESRLETTDGLALSVVSLSSVQCL